MSNRLLDYTVKQLAWVEAMLMGVTPTEAARIAEYAPNTHKQRGHENVTNSYLMELVNKRRLQLQAETGWDIERSQQKLLHAYGVAEQYHQPSAMVSSIVAVNRLYGMDKDAGSPDNESLELTDAQKQRLRVVALNFKDKKSEKEAG